MKKNHYGSIIVAIVKTLKDMRNNWERYIDCEVQTDKLDLLISMGDTLLAKLEHEELSGSHLRSKEYRDLNNKFFDSLKVLNLDLYS